MMMKMGYMSNFVHGLRPVMVMVVVQIAYAGMTIFYKLAADDGMNLTVLVAYGLMFATAFMLPLALIFERNCRPKLTRVVLFQAFLCGLFGGSLAQNLFVQSLALTSATFAAAMPNLIPGITFIMAILFGLEKLGLGTLEGKAKLLGTMIGIGGAMLFTFYKGVELTIWSTHVNLLHHSHQHGSHVASSQGNSDSYVLGSLLALGSCVSYALWLMVQTKMSKRYRANYSSTALMCAMGSIQSVVFALCMERDWSGWKLGWNIRLLTAAYTGIVTFGVVVALIAWCVNVRGPLFVSIFTPLALVLVALAGSLVLDEKLHLGSILGAVLIVCGLYMVLWGKSKETKKITELMPAKQPQESESMEILITSPVNKHNNSNDNISSIASIATTSLSTSHAATTKGDFLERNTNDK